jgi:hypothetical protein
MRALGSFDSNREDAGENRLLERNNFMSVQEVSAERFAQLFHYYSHALANDSGSPANLHTEDAWENVAPSERSKLITAARLALREVDLIPSERPTRRYFAKPGEAEWGC